MTKTKKNYLCTMKVGANLPHKVPLEEIYLFPETKFRHGLRIKLIFLHLKEKEG